MNRNFRIHSYISSLKRVNLLLWLLLLNLVCAESGYAQPTPGLHRIGAVVLPRYYFDRNVAVESGYAFIAGVDS